MTACLPEYVGIAGSLTEPVGSFPLCAAPGMANTGCRCVVDFFSTQLVDFDGKMFVNFDGNCFVDFAPAVFLWFQ